MQICTCELQPRILIATTPADLVWMLRYTSTFPVATDAEYMAYASAILQRQGREAVDTSDARRFLEGMEGQGILRIAPES